MPTLRATPKPRAKPAARGRLQPRRRPSQARAQTTVDVLLEATARILVRRGWAGATTNHIAATAGVSIGTLYEYFPSKDAMVLALVERHLERAEATLGATIAAHASSGSIPALEPLVRTLVDMMIRLHADAPRLHRVLFEEVPHPPVVRRRVRALEDRSAAALAALLPRMPDVAVDRPDVAARLVVDMLESLTHRWITDAAGAPLPAASLADELVRMVVSYLRR